VPSLSDVVNYATSKEGDPYVWGATGPTSFDCSGLVYAAYKAAGFNMPRTTAATIGTMGAGVDEAHAVPGDVVYFNEPGATDHVGIYIGNGQMINAPETGKNVEVDSIKGYTSIRDLTSDSAGTDTLGHAASTVAGQVAGALNPFSGWQTDVLGIVLKLAGAAACIGLVIVGAKETVKDR
jgi:cell wall-associated NlpC family hydrolase